MSKRFSQVYNVKLSLGGNCEKLATEEHVRNLVQTAQFHPLCEMLLGLRTWSPTTTTSGSVLLPPVLAVVGR
jgi:hypothetical protein